MLKMRDQKHQSVVRGTEAIKERVYFRSHSAPRFVRVCLTHSARVVSTTGTCACVFCICY